MTDEPEKLTDADPKDVVFSLAHALRFDGRKHHHRGDGLMAQIVAEHIFKCLEGSGYVIKQKPPARSTAPLSYGKPQIPLKD